MGEKYFKPDITDICVGYETEEIVFEFDVSHDKFFPDEMNKEERIKVWNDFYCSDEFKSVPFTITSAQSVIYSKFPNFPYRTPYLTKEQIEAEGFKFKRNYKDTFYFEKGDVYEIGGIFLDYTISSKTLKVSIYKGKFDNSGTPKEDICFQGKIKCINEFRNILKYLCINT